MRLYLKEAFLVGTSNVSDVCLAESNGRLDQSAKHHLEVERRAADNLEHIGGRGLLLQGFAQLVEQPRVLDGDDCLAGEALNQLDLLFGERPNFLAEDTNCADEPALFEHGHNQKSSGASEPNESNICLVTNFGGEV